MPGTFSIVEDQNGLCLVKEHSGDGKQEKIHLEKKSLREAINFAYALIEGANRFTKSEIYSHHIRIYLHGQEVW